MTKEVPYTQEKRLYGDKRVVCRVVHCAYPDCRKEHAFHVSNGSGGLPTNVWHKLLVNAQWEVWRGVAFCPEHHRDVTRAAKHAAQIASTGNIVEAALSIPEPTIIHIPEPQPEPPVTQPPRLPTPIRTLAELGEATAADVRMMTPEWRRRINRMIGDNWDDTAIRYLGGMSDQKIATELNVPRAWVEQIRVENYGDSGGNEEIEALREDVDTAIALYEPMVRDAQRLVENAVNAVGKMESQLSDLRALKKRLEKIEASILPRRA